MKKIKFIYNDKDFNSVHCLNVVKKQLYNDLYLYIAEIDGNCYNAEEAILANSFIPLIFNLIITSFNKENISNLTDLLKELVGTICSVYVSDINISIENDNSFTFTPLTTLNDITYNVYVHPESKILDICISDFLPYKLIGTSKLIPYTHKILKVKGILYNFNGVYCLKNDEPKNVKDILRRINVLENKGYFYYNNNIDYLTKLWPIEKKDENIYVSEICDSDWIDESLISINSDDLPSYTLTGDWMMILDHNSENKVKLNFNIILAYINLCVKNPVLFRYINDIHIGDDLSITSKFGTYADIINIQRILDTNLDRMSLFKYDNLQEALNNRYIIEYTNKTVITMCLFVDGFYWIVINDENIKITSQLNGNIKIPEGILEIIGVMRNKYLRGIIGIENVLPIIIPGTIEYKDNIVSINWEEKKLFLNNINLKLLESTINVKVDQIQKLWTSGNYLSGFGITKFLNGVSISQSDIKG
jgi:hypothetical protein